MQPGGGLVFVTRQAQSKIDKVLQSGSGAMADILRPFSKLEEKKTKQKTVASSSTCRPDRDSVWSGKASKQHPLYLIFFPSLIGGYRSSACQAPHTAGPPLHSPPPSFFFFSWIQVCAVLVEIRVATPRVLPLQTLCYRGGQSRLF